MLNKLKKSNDQGFTIIEVMIVLAIAGLIILIVLLAVPALQRNGRNTAIKNDASAIAAAISEYESNNDGAIPKAAVQSAATPSAVDICDANPCSAAVAKSTAKVQTSTVVSNVAAATANSATTSPGVGKINIFTGESCNGNASPRAAQIVYSVETSSGSTAKCIDS